MGWEQCGREDKYRKGRAYKQYWELNHINIPISRPGVGVDVMGWNPTLDEGPLTGWLSSWR